MKPPALSVLVQRTRAEGVDPVFAAEAFEDLLRRIGRAFPGVPVEVLAPGAPARPAMAALLRRTGAPRAVRIVGDTAALDASLSRRMAARALRLDLDYLHPLRFPLGFLPAEIVSARALRHPILRGRESHPYALKELRRAKPRGLRTGTFRFERELRPSAAALLQAHRSVYPAMRLDGPAGAAFVRAMRRRFGGRAPDLRAYLRFWTPIRRRATLYRRLFPGHAFIVPLDLEARPAGAYEEWWREVRRGRLHPIWGVGVPSAAWRDQEERLRVEGRHDARLVRRALGVRRGDVVLDYGCGIGRIAAGFGPCGRYLAVDSAPEALRWFHHRRARPGARLALTRDNLLPIEDDAVDAAFAYEVLVHMEREDIVDVLAEIRRVLRPGGRLLFTMPHLGPNLAYWLSLQARNLGPHKKMRRVHPRTEEEVRLLVEAAGLEVVRTDAKAVGAYCVFYLCRVPAGRRAPR